MKGLFARFGVGAATVDSKPLAVATAGETTNIEVEVEGGAAAQTVTGVDLSLRTSYSTSDGAAVGVIETYSFDRNFTIDPSDEESLELSIDVPAQTPVTMGWTDVWIETNLGLAWAWDREDSCYLTVEPTERMDAVFDALAHLGFELHSALPEANSGGFFAERLSYTQRFSFAPQRGPYWETVNELVVTFEPVAGGLEVQLGIDYDSDRLTDLGRRDDHGETADQRRRAGIKHLVTAFLSVRLVQRGMRAIVVPELGSSDVLTVQEVESPEPGPGEVKIAVEAAGINFADIEKRRGRYRDGPEPPYVPGLEVAGRISALGPDVEGWAVGDAVMAAVTEGGYSEEAIADARSILSKPATLSFTEAAGALVQGFTAHNALHEWGGLSGGETVLIHAAAGGVGSTAVQIASQEAVTVIGTASTEAKLDFAREYGLDHGINYEADALDTELDVVLGEDGIDLMLDGVGGNAFYTGLEHLGPGGRAVVYGVAAGRPPTVATPRLFYSNRSVIGYHFGHGLATLPDKVLAARDHLYELLDDGALEVPITETRPLEAAADAHQQIENRDTRGKVVLVP
jgi:NADPH2:quinone reductase